MPSKNNGKRSKAEALLHEGTLNSAPEKVNDPKFRESEFFDPRDVVQVKYEMLRRVFAENTPVTDAAEEYGVSRPTYYQAKANFGEAGIAGLAPKKRGPRSPHKLHGEVLTFLERQVIPGEPIRARKLAALIRQEFELEVHPRTMERALGGKNSKVRSDTTEKRWAEPPSSIAAQYETLRMAALGEPLPPEARRGLGLFLRQGCGMGSDADPCQKSRAADTLAFVDLDCTPPASSRHSGLCSHVAKY